MEMDVMYYTLLDYGCAIYMETNGEETEEETEEYIER